MNDVYRSPEFESIHTLQRRVGARRTADGTSVPGCLPRTELAQVRATSSIPARPPHPIGLGLIQPGRTRPDSRGVGDRPGVVAVQEGRQVALAPLLDRLSRSARPSARRRPAARRRGRRRAARRRARPASSRREREREARLRVVLVVDEQRVLAHRPRRRRSRPSRRRGRRRRARPRRRSAPARRGGGRSGSASSSRTASNAPSL